MRCSSAREELGLQRRGEQADLVQEERPAVAAGRGPLGLARVGEGALLVAEKLGLEQALGDRRAVDVDERLGRARPARRMQRPREQALARAGLAEDEQRGRAHRHRGGANELLNLSPQGDHGGAVPDQIGEGSTTRILPHRAARGVPRSERLRDRRGGTRPSCISAHWAR